MTPRPTRRIRSSVLLLAGLLCAAATHAAHASGDTAVRLLDAAGEPVAHARVKLVGRDDPIHTDAEGRFDLPPGQAPPFELLVFTEAGEFLGRQTVESLPLDGPRVVRLHPLEQVVVTVQGGMAPSTYASPATAVTVIGGEDRTSRQTTRLHDLLAAVPGTTRVGSGHAAVPAVRGLARGRTLLLLDSGRVTSERRAGPSATYVDPFVLASVEVLRGPGSVAYGSDAMGGVIHMHTPRPDASAFAGRYEVGGGIGTGYLSAAVEANVPIGTGALLAQVHGRTFDDYESPDGVVPDSFSGDEGVLLKALLHEDWIVGLQSDRVDATGKPSLGANAVRTIYPEESSDRLSLSGRLPGFAGFRRPTLNLSLGDYRLVTDRDELADGTNPRALFRSDVRARDGLLRLATARPLTRGTLRLGFDVRSRFDMEVTGTATAFDLAGQPTTVTTENSVESATRLDAGLFAEWKHVLPRRASSISLGIRGQSSRTRNRGGGAGNRSQLESRLTGYAAYTWHPAEAWTLTLQGAEGYREPTLSALYFTGVTGRGIINGNPDLRPETSRQLDLSVRRGDERLQLAAYAYLYRIDDIIERFRRPDDEFAWRNRGEQELYGVELEANISLSPKFATRFSISDARGTIRDDQTDAADVPAPTANLGLEHRPDDRTWWRAGLTLTGRDDNPGPTEAATPAYALLDLSGGLRLREHLELRLILTNVLDRTHPASADDDSVAGPGRAAALVLAGSF